MLRLVAIFFLIIHASVSFALQESSNDILGEEPEMKKDKQHLAEKTLDLHLRVSGALGYTSYRLISSGYNVSLPLQLGYLWQVSAGYKIPQSYFAINLEYFGQQVAFNNVSGATPSTISLNTSFYNAAVSYEISNNWSAGLGFGYKQRITTATTPNDVVSSAISSGPALTVKYSRTSLKYQWGSDLLLFFPNYYDETSVSSGFSNSYYGVILRPFFKNEIKPNVFAGISLWFEYDSISFSGLGNRQTIDARESFLKVFVPLFLEIGF
ncbi:MAG: hypothetical protein IPM57_11640 [Oligoflexia bacterium]|nr:hypothetical protein [Oligoflexia bacterium]